MPLAVSVRACMHVERAGRRMLVGGRKNGERLSVGASVGACGSVSSRLEGNWLQQGPCCPCGERETSREHDAMHPHSPNPRAAPPSPPPPPRSSGAQGVGASRVRDLFSTARSMAPAIIFIDEIDSVVGQKNLGESRGNLGESGGTQGGARAPVIVSLPRSTRWWIGESRANLGIKGGSRCHYSWRQ